nr:uncharacterized protein LOC100181914 [Ciona intestinalis]|eukprot:XP_002120753.1 uncharacterized protein LOC100181914 [Ciona intestinalis]
MILPTFRAISKNSKPVCNCVNEYTNLLSASILKESVHTATETLKFEAVVTNYAENISNEIVSQSTNLATKEISRRREFEQLSALIVDEVMTVVPILDSGVLQYAESLSNMLVDSACEEIVKRGKDLNDYSERLADSILNSSWRDLSHPRKKPRKTHKPTSLAIAEQYANQFVKTFSWDFESSMSKSYSALNSSTSSVLSVNSEALTPCSVVGEGWKKGLHHFADQLLYSLSNLEENEFGCGRFHEPVERSRTFRSGSCPHILRIPTTVHEVRYNRRQSETLCRYSRNIDGFADSLSNAIVQSTLLRF